MKFLIIGLWAVLLFFSSLKLEAQKIHPLLVPCNEKLGFKHFITKTPWRVQLAWTVIDDDGKPFNDLFDVKNSWNFPPYPTRIAVEKECNHNLNVELALSYNNFKTGKIINGDVLTANKPFFSVDVNGKYIVTKKYLMEPYVLLGIGYTQRSTTKYTSAVNANIGVGATIWVIDNVVAINLQGTGKFGLQGGFPSSGSNYLHHSIGAVYKFSGNYKRLKASKKHIKTLF